MAGVQDDPDGPEGAEDWEHNEERADDDLEMGEEGGSDQDSPPNTSPRCGHEPVFRLANLHSLALGIACLPSSLLSLGGCIAVHSAMLLAALAI